MATQPIIIKNWYDGIGDSPHVGLGLVKNADIEAFPGAVKVAKKPITHFHASTVATFTADAGTDVCTTGTFSTGSTVQNTGTAVTVSSTGTLPAGLAANTNYFIIRVSGTTFKLATTIANANASTAINITDAGTGTHTVTTVEPGTIKHIVEETRTTTNFAIDSNGRVWYSDGSRFLLLNGNTLTNAAGNGLLIFRVSDDSAAYLFAFRNASIDVCNVYATANRENPSWSNSWQSMNSGAGSGNSHHAITAQDNINYFCDGRYIGTIKENSGSVFDPATGGTYTYNNQALDMPQGEVNVWLEELGTNLLSIGGTSNKIYPWDRISDSFNLPILVPEICGGNAKMKNLGSVVYILAGQKGNIYTTQGSYVRHFKRVPDYITNNSGTLQANVITWGGISAINGALLFGMGVLTSGNSGAYLLQPDGRLVLDNIPHSGSANVTALFAKTDFYYMGFASGASSMDTNRYDSFETVLQSALYQVSTKTEKGSFSELEVQVAKPASSGDIRVGYRQDASSSFTTLATYTADGSTTSFKTDIGLIDIEKIQVQVEMDGNFELVEVRLLP